MTTDRWFEVALYAAMVLPLFVLVAWTAITERRARRRRARQFLVDMTACAVERLSPAGAVAVVSGAVQSGLLTKKESLEVLDRPRNEALAQAVARWA